MTVLGVARAGGQVVLARGDRRAGGHQPGAPRAHAGRGGGRRRRLPVLPPGARARGRGRMHAGAGSPNAPASAWPGACLARSAPPARFQASADAAPRLLLTALQQLPKQGLSHACCRPVLHAKAQSPAPGTSEGEGRDPDPARRGAQAKEAATAAAAALAAAAGTAMAAAEELVQDCVKARDYPKLRPLAQTSVLAGQARPRSLTNIPPTTSRAFAVVSARQ